MSKETADSFLRLAEYRRRYAETIDDPKWRNIWLATASYFEGRANEEYPVTEAIEDASDDDT